MGILGMMLVPTMVLLDTLWSMRRGWSLSEAGSLAIVIWLCLILATVAPLLLFARTTRALLRDASTGLLAAAVAMLVGWMAGEWAITYWAPPPPSHGRMPHAKYVFHPDPRVVPGVRGEARSSYNSAGLRGDEMPSGDGIERILCIGGGTTECCYLDDQECWPARLAAELSGRGNRVWVAAAATGPCAAADHLRFVRESTISTKVNCLVLLVGANDLVRAVLGMGSGTATPPRWFRSGIVRLAKDVWNGQLGHGFVYDPSGEWLSIQRRRRPVDRLPIDRLLEDRLTQYRRTMADLCTTAKPHGQRIVLVTQPVLWGPGLTSQGERRLWLARSEPEPRRWSFLRPEPLRAAMNRFNATLVDVASRHGVELVAAAEAMSGQEQFFYDDFHLNELGCSRLATLIADEMTAHRHAMRTTSMRASRPTATVNASGHDLP